MDATPFARELAEPVRQALALLESALAHGPGFDPATSTRAFRFYMSDLGQIEFLPPLVERVQRAAPGVRLEAVALGRRGHRRRAGGRGARPRGRLPAGARAAGAAHALFRDPYVCLMRADHPMPRRSRRRSSWRPRTRWSPTAAAHRVIEEALERAGVARRIALRVPHFTVVPMVLERTDLILTLPARVARVYERRGNFKSLPPPVPIPPAEVAVHWHERFEADPGNRWLREQIVELFASSREVCA